MLEWRFHKLEIFLFLTLFAFLESHISVSECRLLVSGVDLCNKEYCFG